MIRTTTYLRRTETKRDFLAAFSSLDHATSAALTQYEIDREFLRLLVRLAVLCSPHGAGIPRRMLARAHCDSREAFAVVSHTLDEGASPEPDAVGDRELPHEVAHFSRIVEVGAAGFEAPGGVAHGKRLRRSSRMPESLKVLPRHIHACRLVLGRYCWQERKRLCGVFLDYGVAHDVVTRPGLTGLSDVVRLPDSFTGVVDNSAHPLSDTTITKTFTYRIRTTRARLLLVRPELPQPALCAAESEAECSGLGETTSVCSTGCRVVANPCCHQELSRRSWAKRRRERSAVKAAAQSPHAAERTTCLTTCHARYERRGT